MTPSWREEEIRFTGAAALLGAVFAVAACSPGRDTATEGALYTGTKATPRETTATRARVRLPSLQTPATFETLSQEPPIESINLRADGVFLSRMVLRDGQRQHEMGRWQVSDDGDRLLLYGGRGDARAYAIESPQVLLPLEADGQPHESAEERRLGRSDLYDPIHDTMRFVGTARYMADAAVFTECASQLRLPIAMERDYLSFERAYLEHRPEPGAPLLVSLRGHLEERPAMEGGGTTEILVIESFERAWPGQSCPTGPEYQVSLKTTHWQLVSALGVAASAPPGGRAPYLTLEAEFARARGSLGCQEFTCSYSQDESLLRFEGFAKSRANCEWGGELAAAYEEALRTCTSYRIEGEVLFLYGEEEVSARFVAARAD